jgi:hypothetical protein
VTRSEKDERYIRELTAERREPLAAIDDIGSVRGEVGGGRGDLIGILGSLMSEEKRSGLKRTYIIAEEDARGVRAGDATTRASSNGNAAVQLLEIVNAFINTTSIGEAEVLEGAAEDSILLSDVNIGPEEIQGSKRVQRGKSLPCWRYREQQYHV